MAKDGRWVERESRSARCIKAFVIGADGRERPVEITDISNHGCRLTMAERLAAGEQVRIEVPRLGGFAAQVRWVVEANAGAEIVPDSDVWDVLDVSCSGSGFPILAPTRRRGGGSGD